MQLYTFKQGETYPVFVGQLEAVIDSVTGKELIPAYGTQSPVLDEKAGFQRYFKDGKWQYVVDHIGKEYWDADGTKHTISELGVEVPKEALLEAPVIPPSTEELAAQARAKRDALVDQVTREINRLEDAGKDAKAWRDYRVVLRNVPEQAGFPQEIDWGKQPAAFTGK
ncbi:hypothetical protein MSP8887_02656 [Marinomonas spartinae]|uniref:phage tail assembly chaperone n=1 Tax=Marinomonas spartinae TaxID=1792290 RepID=UPI000808AFC0|nr:phage tail assembly chaperone [Marinomonas spartinae]SBS36625.1 hypothetical protein MSP8887_02656 [Marinomonas spartinae]